MIRNGIESLKSRIATQYPESKVTQIATDSLRAQYPGAPEEYWALLEDIGWGTIGRSRLMIYGGPIPAEEIFPAFEGVLRNVVFVGDDFSGTSVGYVKGEPWRLVVVDHTSPSDFSPPTEPSLLEFLSAELA